MICWRRSPIGQLCCGQSLGPIAHTSPAHGTSDVKPIREITLRFTRRQLLWKSGPNSCVAPRIRWGGSPAMWTSKIYWMLSFRSFALANDLRETHGFMDKSSPQNTVPRSHPHLRHDLLHRARRWRSLLRPCPWTGGRIAGPGWSGEVVPALHENNAAILSTLSKPDLFSPSFPRGTASGAVRSGERIGASDGG